MARQKANRVTWVLAAIAAPVAGSVALIARPGLLMQLGGPLDWIIFINEVAMSSAIIWFLGRESRGTRGRTLGIVLASALLGTTLLATPLPMAEAGVVADPLMFFFALILVVLLASTRRWNLFWLGMAALWGGLLLTLRLVGIGMSFMG